MDEYKRKITADDVRQISLGADPDYEPYVIHPANAIFPLLPADQMAEFTQSVLEFGQAEPILLSADGSTIVDGKIRYLACIATGQWPVFRKLSGQFKDSHLVAWIVAGNLRHQHFTSEQLAAFEAKIRAYLAG